VTLEFLSPDRTAAGGPAARSLLERRAREAGARIVERDGWRIPADYGDPAAEAERLRTSVGYADRSALGKLELQADPGELASQAGAELRPGWATRMDDGWWCPLTNRRALRLTEPAATRAERERLEAAGASVVDLTAGFAALLIAGPLARETFARLSALDLRPDATPSGAFRPGSVARIPAMVVCEDTDRFLLLFGSAHADYLWTAVSDAAEHLGGGPVGADA
jgi:glycine cleavage system aminomethyltransferase T